MTEFERHRSRARWATPESGRSIGRDGVGARPRIVALIPAHQEENSIARTVGALLQQERQPDHIVVVADNCRDETVARARAAAASSDHVTVIETPDNDRRKPGALNWAWNRFCQDADLVVTLDADTCLPPNAVGDWVAEFEADPTLGGSSSKFTMPSTGGGGGNVLVRLQRYEFARWTLTGLRRGWTSVLAGTGCVIRNSVLKQVAARGDRVGPWSYESEVEDFELTYRIRELGYHCHISPTVRAYTDAMEGVRELWNQRRKWQDGTVRDLLAFGVNKLTMIDWLQQAAGLAAAIVRLAWVTITALGLALGMLHFYWLWFLPVIIFIANDTRQALYVPHKDMKDVFLAALLLPQEFFAWMRAAWFLSSWASVLAGLQRDGWARQYAAEGNTILTQTERG
jgi:biofilm PGA synthesis N-glycosyltransferase PgaC